jgi:hypothetical protein
MQVPTAAPRDTLTQEQVVFLIQDSPTIEIDYGLELIDRNLTVIEDISDQFWGGQVQRQSFATLHGNAQIHLSMDLDWGTAIIRPYVILAGQGDSDGTNIKARFNMGAYFLATPKTVALNVPRIVEAVGYDILHALNDPVGESYAVDAGVAYLDAVEAILLDRGYPLGTYQIDSTSIATLLPAARTWPLDANTTWLKIVNDLLAAIAYQGVWSDWDGRLQVKKYASPLDRPVEWYYDTGEFTSMISPSREIDNDFYNTPNRWVAWRSNLTNNAAPIEGNGKFTYVNQSNGPSSVDARDRTITKAFSVEAADQVSLEARARITIDADMTQTNKLRVSTSPNPLHWHFDRLLLNDPEIGALTEIQGTEWTLAFDGSDQSHEWTVLT